MDCWVSLFSSQYRRIVLGSDYCPFLQRMQPSQAERFDPDIPSRLILQPTCITPHAQWGPMDCIEHNRSLFCLGRRLHSTIESFALFPSRSLHVRRPLPLIGTHILETLALSHFSSIFNQAWDGV